MSEYPPHGDGSPCVDQRHAEVLAQEREVKVLRAQLAQAEQDLRAAFNALANAEDALRHPDMGGKNYGRARDYVENGKVAARVALAAFRGGESKGGS